jgi:hypothetical protein
LAQATGVSTAAAPLTLTHSPSGGDKWVTIKVKNGTATQAGQKVWVNTTYTSAASVNTRTGAGSLAPPGEDTGTITASSEATLETLAELSVYPNPTSGEVYFTLIGVSDQSELRFNLYDLNGRLVINARGNLTNIQDQFNDNFRHLSPGMYVLQAEGVGLRKQVKLVKM